MKNKKGFSIKQKVILLATLLLFNVAMMGFYGYRSTAVLVEFEEDLVGIQIPSQRHADMIDMMHDAILGSAYHALLKTAAPQEEKKQIFDDYNEHTATVKAELEGIAKLKIDADIRQALNEATPLVEDYLRASEDVVGPALAGQVALARTNLPRLEESFKALEGKLEKFSGLIEKDSEGTGVAAREAGASQQRAVMLFVAIALLIGSVGSVYLTRDLSRALQKAIVGLNAQATEITGSSGRISDMATKVSSASSEQAAAIQETAASVEEITAMVKKTSESSTKLGETAHLSQKAAQRGQGAVDDMLRAIGEISSSNTRITQRVEESNNRITEIVKVIGEIGSKTKVINDIVFQTKLLSFNASVEAARAGEHGKGFAVVAEEVGNLAQMSGTAAKEISDMLDSSLHKVESIVSETKSSIEVLVTEAKTKTQNGVEVAKLCGVSLGEITKQVNEVDVMIQEISTAIREQTQGISEISKAIAELDSATQQNAASAEQSAGVAQGLLDRSRSLVDIVDNLQIVALGPDSEVSAPAEESTGHDTQEIVQEPVRVKKAGKGKAAKKLAVVRTAEDLLEHDLDVPNENDPRFRDAA